MNRLYIAPTTLPDTAPLEYVRAAAAAGYDGVGLRLNASPGMPYFPVTGNAALVRELRAVLEGNGMDVLDIYSFYMRPDTDVGAFQEALELGASFGARYALVMGDDPEWPRLLERFGRFCDLASAAGLTPLIEAAVTRPVANLAHMQRLITDSGRNNAVVYIDPLNFARAGDTPAMLRAADPRLFPCAQMTDGLVLPGEPDPTLLGHMSPNQRRLMGEGNVPVAAILDALPPGIPLSVELQPPPGAIDPYAWAASTARNVRQWLTSYYASKGGA